MNPPLVYNREIIINADIQKVWDALINPELTKHYMFGCIPITDWKVGSSLIWRGAADNIDYVTGTVVSFVPEDTLAFTVFDPNAGYKDIPENHLTSTYKLSSVPGGTKVHVSQGDFNKVENGEKRFIEAESGWKMALDALAKVLEQ